MPVQCWLVKWLHVKCQFARYISDPALAHPQTVLGARLRRTYSCAVHLACTLSTALSGMWLRLCAVERCHGLHFCGAPLSWLVFVCGARSVLYVGAGRGLSGEGREKREWLIRSLIRKSNEGLCIALSCPSRQPTLSLNWDTRTRSWIRTLLSRTRSIARFLYVNCYEKLRSNRI